MSTVALNTANSELSVLDFKKRHSMESRQSFYQYEWFVSFMLLACDAVLLLGRRGGWEDVVKNDLGYHRRYLKSKIFEKQSFDVQSDAIQRMIKELKPTKTKRRKLAGGNHH